MMESLVTQLHEMYTNEIRNKDTRIHELERDFTAYRESNDIDRYFTMNLTEETRARVL